MLTKEKKVKTVKAKSSSEGILNKGFEDAIKSASDYVRTNESLNSKETTEEIIKGCQVYYQEKQELIDAAIENAVALMKNPKGENQLTELKKSFSLDSTDGLNLKIADQLKNSPEINNIVHAAETQRVKDFGIGVSAGASFIAGVLAGADVVFDLDDGDITGRTWAGLSAKTGIAIDLGLEMSFWYAKPTTGKIWGTVIDIASTDYEFPLFVRLMYINSVEVVDGSFETSYSGLSIQFPFGLGFPIRVNKDYPGAIVGKFGCKQNASPKGKKALVSSILNPTSSLAQIAIGETTSLEVSLSNNVSGGVDITPNETTIQFNMPNYFDSSNVSDIGCDLENWDLTADGNNLLLTYTGTTYNWGSETMDFNLTNVRSSNATVSSGSITTSITGTGLSYTMTDPEKFDLVMGLYSVVLDWHLDMNGTAFELQEGYASDGNSTVWMETGNPVYELSRIVQNSNGKEWILGYQFSNDVDSSGNPNPMVQAVWQDASKQPIQQFMFFGNKVLTASTDKTSVAYYNETNTEPYDISIDVTFGNENSDNNDNSFKADNPTLNANTESTASENTATVADAQIEWGNDSCDDSKLKVYDFQTNFASAPSVCVNRTKSNTEDILPVVTSTTSNFSIQRSSSISGIQPFDWITIGQGLNQIANSGYSAVIVDGVQVAMLQWGSSTSRSKSSEYFSYNRTFNVGCYSVIVNRKSSGSKDILPVVEAGSMGFKIDRSGDISGDQDFFWIAVGDCQISGNKCFEVDLGGKYMLKGGVGTSTTKNAEEFTFASFGLSPFGSNCTSVVTNRTGANSKDILPISSKATNGFTIDRNSSISGNQEFYWLALGKN